MRKINNKKLVPIYAILGTIGVIWFFLIGIPLFNSGLNYVNSNVPEKYKLPIGLSVVVLLSLSFAFLIWKYIAPKLKELSSSKFDKPSLAVVMSGSSGSGVFRAFKNVTDLKFASVIKGMLFDVERETMTTHNEGAIHALRYPVQAAKTGFKGAVGARRIEYESAKKAFDQFFKPFARKINSIVRITGIGRGYTSISTTTKFDFIDFSRFPGNNSSTLFDLIVVEKLEDKSDENIIKQRSLFLNKNIENSVYKVSGESVNQNAIHYQGTPFLATSLDSLRDAIGNIKNFEIYDSKQKLIPSNLVKIDEKNRIAIIECKDLEKINSVDWVDVNNRSQVSVINLAGSKNIGVNAEIDSINESLGIAKITTTDGEVESGSVLLCSNKIAGIIITPKPSMVLSISTSKIQESIDDLVENKSIQNKSTIQL